MADLCTATGELAQHPARHWQSRALARAARRPGAQHAPWSSTRHCACAASPGKTSTHARAVARRRRRRPPPPARPRGRALQKSQARAGSRTARPAPLPRCRFLAYRRAAGNLTSSSLFSVFVFFGAMTNSRRGIIPYPDTQDHGRGCRPSACWRGRHVPEQRRGRVGRNPRRGGVSERAGRGRVHCVDESAVAIARTSALWRGGCAAHKHVCERAGAKAPKNEWRKALEKAIKANK